MQVSIELTGNGYIEIQRDNANRVVALWQRSSAHTAPFRLPSGELIYRTTDNAAGTAREIKTVDMIHIMGMNHGGHVGLNPLESFRGSIGAKLAMDKFAARFFANNATPSGILTTVQKVKPEDKEKMRTDWETLHAGRQQHRVGVLDQEMKFQSISTTQNDSQFNESKIEVAKEIAAFFGVQGYAVGLLDKGIKANVEQQAQDLYNYCLRPRMAKWEMAFTNKLFSSKGRSAGRFGVQFNTFELLHPDSASIIASNQSSIQNGVLTPNEGRTRLRLNCEDPEGDFRYIQLNMQTLKTANLVTPAQGYPDTELALEGEENSLPRLGASYRGLFKDGVQRIIKTTNRDYKTVYRCLWPTLDALAQAARSGRNLEDFSETTKAVEDLIEKIEHRAKKWVEADIESVCDEEMRKIATKLIFAVNHDVANQKSKAEIAKLTAEEAEQENENVQ